MSVESEYAKGSTFTLRLPAEVKEARVEPAQTSVSSRPAGEGTGAPSLGTVLIIDDDPTASELLERCLIKEGFAVEAARTGQQGIEMARRLPLAAILLDVMMPGMDGWSVLAALKADPQLATIPVIMITVVDNKNLGFALGAAEYLTKPIDWARLATVLKKYQKGPASHLVLVAEDDAATRDLVERSLGKDGWAVVTAENGRVALELVVQKRPELILLDLMMPEMDGFEFMQALRQREECRELPVIVITAKDLTDEDRRRLAGQVDRIIQKGTTSLEQLLAEVRVLMAKQDKPRVASNLRQD